MVEKSIKSANLSDASEGLIKAKHFYDTCMDVTSIEADNGEFRSNGIQGLMKQVSGTKLASLLHTGAPEDSSLFGFENGTGRWALIDPDYSDFSTLSMETQIGR